MNQISANGGVPIKTGVPWMAIFSIVSSLLYGVSPIDLIPDFIPLLGWVDDAILAPLLLLIGVVMLARRHNAAKRVNSVIDVPARS